MKQQILYFVYIIPSLLIISCSSGIHYDASGSFEAIERIISAQATGKIERLDIEEGQTLAANTTVGQIDVTLLELQYQQVKAHIEAISQKVNDATPQVKILKVQFAAQQKQVESLEAQLHVLNKEVNRFKNLVASGASPQKQLDDLVGQQLVLRKKLEVAQTQSRVVKEKIRSTKRTIHIQNRAVLSEIQPTKKQLDLLEQQINYGTIVNEYRGTVISKYAYAGEFTQIGKPLYKIADLSHILLRAYITADQFSSIKLGDSVSVVTDSQEEEMSEKKGVIAWISNKAEFTPKSIQTKDERANKVYAIKVRVANDGTYKIGMYGEIKFNVDE